MKHQPLTVQMKSVKQDFPEVLFGYAVQILTLGSKSFSTLKAIEEFLSMALFI